MNRINFWLFALLLPLLSACTKAQQPLLEKIDTLTVPYGIQSIAWHPNGQWLAVGYFLRDEVEVWDVKTKTSVLKVPRKHSTQNPSGQEALFSVDGKYLIVQDFTDTKTEGPKFPRNQDDVAELPAQNDSERYVLARLWDVEKGVEITQFKGAGSTLHGGGPRGMCFVGDRPNSLVLLRSTLVSSYGLMTGIKEFDLKLEFPFADKPDFGWGYRKMSCNSARAELALEGAKMFKKAPLFGYAEDSGATPIVVVNMERKAIKKVLFSATPLNGAVYTADGSKLVSFGMSPIRVWDADKEFAPIGEINNPPEWLTVHQQGLRIDMLNPPANVKLGNSGNFVPVSGTDLMLGLSGDLYMWSTNDMKAISHYAPSLPDIFRIAAHQPTAVFAVADGATAHFYRFNRTAYEAQSKGAKQ